MNKTPHILFVEGVKGEVREPGFQDWIYMESVGKSISNPAVKKGTALASSTASFGPFTFTKAMDKSSPQLFMAMITGRWINEITAVFRRIGKMDPKGGGSTLEPYLEWKFKDCYIASVQMSGANLSDPSESISIYYAEQIETFFSIENGKRKDTAVGSWSMRTRTGSVS
jgi:type VI secretion system Hcp family effector